MGKTNSMSQDVLQSTDNIDGNRNNEDLSRFETAPSPEKNQKNCTAGYADGREKDGIQLPCRRSGHSNFRNFFNQRLLAKQKLAKCDLFNLKLDKRDIHSYGNFQVKKNFDHQPNLLKKNNCVRIVYGDKDQYKLAEHQRQNSEKKIRLANQTTNHRQRCNQTQYSLSQMMLANSSNCDNNMYVVNSPTGNFYDTTNMNQFIVKAKCIAKGITPSQMHPFKISQSKAFNKLESQKYSIVNNGSTDNTNPTPKRLLSGTSEKKILVTKKLNSQSSRFARDLSKSDVFNKLMKNTNGISNLDNVFHTNNEENSELRRFRSASNNLSQTPQNVTKSGFYRKNTAKFGNDNIINGDQGKITAQQEHICSTFKKKREERPKDIRRYPNFYYMYKQKRGKCIQDFNKRAKTDRI